MSTRMTFERRKAIDKPQEEDGMAITFQRNKHMVTAGALVTASLITAANMQAQTPAQGDSIIVVEKPNYVTIVLETTVNKPVADVWARIGGYCTIGEWLQIAAGCKILSG